MSTIKVRVPSELADSLVADNEAVRPSAMRGPAGDLVHIVVDSTNAGASLVTVVLAVAAIPRLAARVSRWARRSTGDADRVTISGPGGEVVIEIPPDASTDEITVQVEEAIERVRASRSE